jgi:hypothetical protein
VYDFGSVDEYLKSLYQWKDCRMQIPSRLGSIAKILYCMTLAFQFTVERFAVYD